MAECFNKKVCRGGLCLYQWGVHNTFFLCGEDRECMSFPESFSLEGLYVFAVISDMEGFFTGCVEMQGQAMGRLRILWVENPEADSFKWRCHGILTTAVNPIIAGQWGFRFYGYYLDLFLESGLKTADEEFLLEGEVGIFQTPRARLPLGHKLTVSLADGVMNFQLISSGTKENLFHLMDAGMIYGRLLSKEGDAEFERGFVDSVANRLLFWKEAMTVNAYLDPRSVADMGLSGEKTGRSQETGFYLPAGAVLPTSFTDCCGRPMDGLVTETTRLVFQKTPEYQYTGMAGEKRTNSRYYLGLAGDMVLIPQGNSSDLLCGLIGTESIQTKEDRIPVCFVPGGRVMTDEEGNLTDLGEASWVEFPENSLYLSQPEGNPLFAYESGGGLNFKPLAQCRIQAGQTAVPLFPWRNAVWNTAADPYPKMLEGILRNRRHNILTGLPHGVNAESGKGTDSKEVVLTASVQGLLVGLSGQGPLASWDFLSLGKGPDGKELRIWGMDDGLRARFQNPSMTELFRSREELTEHTERLDGFQMEIGGWGFQLDPAVWRQGNEGQDDGNTATCMVAKYSSEVSLREILQGEPVFEQSLKACYTETGDPRSEYAAFLKWVDDPLFLGCLFLNCPIDVVSGKERMIPEVRLMLDGISPEDTEALYAHHVLIGKSRLSTEGGLQIEQSPVSAVVEYTGGEAASYSRDQNVGPDAEFTTISFLMAVEQSKVTVLNSVSELVLNRLFGAKCTGNGGSGNSLVVDGALRREEGESFFEYTLRSSASYSLSGMLEKTEISALKLSSSPELSTFYLAGRMFFAYDGECDLFSYGEEPKKEGGALTGLSFTGLEVTLGRGGSAPEFRYGRMLLDPLSSQARAQSLAARFPAEISGFLEEKETDSPVKHGYTLLQSPMRQSPMTAPWYGLRFRIPLGSLGDLSQTGPLDLELLAAWSADGPDGAGCFLGVKLPAALGGEGLDLQGFLKLGFSSVDILTEGDDEQRLHYSLRLNQFTVRALWVTFPPGSNCIHIVADPKGKELGWYAAYLDEG